MGERRKRGKEEEIGRVERMGEMKVRLLQKAKYSLREEKDIEL